MKHALTYGILAAAMALLAACSSGPVEYKPLTFTHYQPIYLTVSSIEIVDDYKSPMHPPYIEHLIPYSPAEAMRIWVRDRLRAGGGNKTMQIIIRNGAVTATDLPSGGGLSFGSNRRYDAKLEVELRVYGEGVISEASVFVNGTRNITLPGNAGDDVRNKAFRKLIGDLMEEFNAEMEKNLYQYMGNYISFTQSP
jgi:hypothetical protein